MSVHRRMGNAGFVLLVRILFGGRYTDLCYGYNAFWKRVLPLLDLDSDGFEIETSMNVRALRAGLTVHEVPSFERRRYFGKSNLRAIPDGMRVLRTILREATRTVGPAGSPHRPMPKAVTAVDVRPADLVAVVIERAEDEVSARPA